MGGGRWFAQETEAALPAVKNKQRNRTSICHGRLPNATPNGVSRIISCIAFVSGNSQFNNLILNLIVMRLEEKNVGKDISIIERDAIF